MQKGRGVNKEWGVGWIAGIVLAITTLVAQEDSRREKEPRGGGEMRMPTPAFQTTVPEQIMDCVAGRPTQRAVTLSLLFYREPVEACVVYEPISGGGELRTERMRYGKGEPTELSLEGLKPDTAYRYGVEWRRLGEEAWTGGWKGRFRTARRSACPLSRSARSACKARA